MPASNTNPATRTLSRAAIALAVSAGGAAYYYASHVGKTRQLKETTFPQEATLGPGEAPDFHMVMDGDSVALGLGASTFEHSVAGRVAAALSRERTVHLQNRAVSGATMPDIACKPLPLDDVDLIVLMIGSNDFFRFRPLGAFREAARVAFGRYANAAENVIVVGPGRIFQASAVPAPLRAVYRRRARAYGDALAEEALRFRNVVHVDPTNPPRGILPPTNSSSLDGFHPNDAGHAYWAELTRAGLEDAGLMPFEPDDLNPTP